MKNKRLILFLNLYFIFTLFFYFMGRYQWFIPNDTKLFITIVIFYFAFNAGYFINYFKFNNKTKKNFNTNVYSREHNKQIDYYRHKKLFLLSCILLIVFQIAWVITVLGKFSIFEVFQNIGTNYFSRLDYVPESSVLIMQIRTLFWGLTLFAYPFGFTHFKTLSIGEKSLLFTTVLVDVISAINMGISKNIGDILLIFIMVLLIQDKYKISNNKIYKNKYFFKIVITATSFLIIFSMLQVSRNEFLGAQNYSNPYYKFSEIREDTIYDYFLEPLGLTSIFDQMGAYVSHGYTGLAYALELPFQNTSGIGFSRALMEYFDQYLNVDFSKKTYPARIEPIFGWPNGMYWPSSFTWFASAVSFFGVPIVMLLFGFAIYRIYRRFFIYRDIYSISLLAQLFIQAIYFPSNAQIFQSRSSLFGTIFMIVAYLFSWRYIKNEEKI